MLEPNDINVEDVWANKKGNIQRRIIKINYNPNEPGRGFLLFVKKGEWLPKKMMIDNFLSWAHKKV